MEVRRKQGSAANYASGAGLVIFSFAPVLGIISTLPNVAYYVTGLAIVAATGILSLLFGRPNIALGVGWWALAALLVVMSLWSPTYSRSDQWEALLSIFLCVIAVCSIKCQQRDPLIKSIIWGVVAVGVIASLYTTYDPRFVLMKGGGWVDENLSYLLLGAPVAASVGPGILFLARSRTKFVWLAVLTVVVIGVGSMLSRTAVLSAIASGALAALFLLHRKNKMATVLKGIALVLPLLPVLFLSIVNSNAGLNRRFERMLDPSLELLEGGRGYIWQRAAELISERPFVGWGVKGIQNQIGNHPHNAILEAWGDLGLAGFVAVGSIFIAFFMSLLREVFRNVDHESFALHLIAFVFAVESLKSQSLYLSRATLVLIILAPILARRLQSARGDNIHSQLGTAHERQHSRQLPVIQ